MTPGLQQPQTVPVQMHQTHDLLVLAAPMPGLEPADIAVTIRGDHLTICGEYRGSRHDQPEILLSEWTVGPQYREVSLPQLVGWRVDQCDLWQRRAGPVHAEAGTWSAGSHTEFRPGTLTDTRGQRAATGAQGGAHADAGPEPAPGPGEPTDRPAMSSQTIKGETGTWTLRSPNKAAWINGCSILRSPYRACVRSSVLPKAARCALAEEDFEAP